MKLFIFSLVCFRKHESGDVSYRAAPFYAFTDDENTAKKAATEYHLENNPIEQGFFDHDVAMMEVPGHLIFANVNQ